MIDAVRAGNKDAEFILVAPTVPNPEAADFVGSQTQYEPVLQRFGRNGRHIRRHDERSPHLLKHKNFW